ncbi:general secretion pathway protein GspB [Marinobacter lipolyticus]|uniref:general secretion pathway protein GspB n=1 Tax=Marinobacter lipolyticus TaxID=209639 RepID=UPI003A8E88A6
MSYILDALRKSEAERRQGKVPDLGQQVQLIHKPRKKSVSAAFWVAIALIINAAVLVVIFWPRSITVVGNETDVPVADQNVEVIEPETPAESVQSGSEAQTPDRAPETDTAETLPVPSVDEPVDAIAESGEAEPRLRPTVIVPNRTVVDSVPAQPDQEMSGRVPHLVELPLPFQKSIPDLIFNSHIYSSEPTARRVMINNQYMRAGDSFSGIRVERITEEGVVLSKNGRQFRVGVVRDWMSPR